MVVLRRHDDMRVKILTHLSKLKDNVINYYCNKKKNVLRSTATCVMYLHGYLLLMTLI